MIEFPDNIWNPIIYSTITVSTLYSGFLCIRPWIKINVECWFCMSKHRIRYLDRNSWYCPCCQQYNGFNVDGSYNRHMNEHYYQSNSNYFCQNNSIINNQFRYEHYRLCDDCNEREAIKIRMIAQFVPVDEQRFDEELFQFRKNLEQMYPICENCNQLVRKLINDIDDSCPKPKSPNRISNSAATTTTSLLHKNQPGKLLKIFAYSLLNLSTILMLFILFCLNVHEEPVSSFAKEFLPNPLSQVINYTNHYHYMICLGFLLYFPLLQIESNHLVIIDILQICFWLLLITNHHHYYHLFFLDKFDIIRLQRFIIPLLIVTYLIKYFYTIIYDYIWIAANHNHNHPLNDTANRKYSKSINDEKLIRNQIKDLSISTTNEFDLFSLGNNINIQSPFTRISSKSSKFTNYSLFTNANFMAANTMNNDDNFLKSNITTATTTTTATTMMNSPRILNYYIRYEIDRSNNNDNNCCKHHDQQQHSINKHSTNSLCLHLTTTFTLILTLTIFMLMIVILSLPATIKINYEIHDDNHLSLNIFYPNYTVN
ncbi:uncharacterized protein LOC113789491 [Dermatophagoides pteronyssinus]|uniref:uncharacterized protein LOC113789491 n=1 Tax=Dermatophagoides pteronyssinus TaxID=6956 RepID=UPI003F661F7F